MSRNKLSEPDGFLFGLPVVTPEWQARREDARQRESEKTRALRAARLAAQERLSKAIAKSKTAAKSRIKTSADAA